MGLNESNYDGKTLINVDIQPEYEKWVSFDLHQWANMVNNHKGEIVFLYNGADTMGMISEIEYQDWLIDHVGINEDIVLGDATFYDKGYAFFRYCIDNKIEEQQLIDLIKFMIEKEIDDSRHMDKEFWNEFIAKHTHTHHDIRYLLELSDDCINIPELMDFLRNYSNIVICGGGANECLKEVEIALHALGKQFETYHDYVYEEDVTKKTTMRENQVDISKEPNIMHFFHGGDLDEVKQDPIQRSDRQVHGPGLYLTTNWERAKKYAKGGRKMYIVSVEKGNNLDDKDIDMVALTQFLKQNLSPKKVQYVLDRANTRLHGDKIPAYIVNNILIDSGFLKSNFSLMWKTFLIGVGIDYVLDETAFGGEGQMMVLYNTSKIKNIRRIMPTDKLPAYDLRPYNLNEHTDKEKTFSGKMVWRHILSITPDKDDIPWGFEKYITTRMFKNLDNFDISSLLQTDPDFKDYYDSQEQRYDPDEVDPNEIHNEIVVVDGTLLDGYSRAATLLHNNQQTTNAFVAI